MSFLKITEIILLTITVYLLLIISRSVDTLKQVLNAFKGDSCRELRSVAKINYHTNLELSDSSAAYRDLLFIIYFDLMNCKGSEHERRQKYNELKSEDEGKFLELGYNFPEYPF